VPYGIESSSVRRCDRPHYGAPASFVSWKLSDQRVRRLADSLESEFALPETAQEAHIGQKNRKEDASGSLLFSFPGREEESIYDPGLPDVDIPAGRELSRIACEDSRIVR
jgi:hypothetical protein